MTRITDGQVLIEKIFIDRIKGGESQDAIMEDIRGRLKRDIKKKRIDVILKELKELENAN